MNALWNHYKFTFFFANLLWIHCFLNSLPFSRISYEFPFVSANSLWIHFRFRESAMNSLSFTRIQYEFVFCCLYSLSISRIYHEFTIYFAIHYRSSFFFANSLWNYFKFPIHHTYSLLIHFLFGVITIDTLFFREFTFCTSLFELTIFFREFTKNTLSASVIQDVFTIFFAKILWEHYPLHENTIRALSFIAKILWEHYAGVQLLIHHNFSSKKWSHDSIYSKTHFWSSSN